MPTDTTSSRICVWIDPSQTQWVRDAAAAAGLSIVGAGCWATGQSTALASALCTTPMDDLRSMVAAADTDAIFIAQTGDFGSRPEDLRAIAAARQRGVRLCSLDPIPQSVFDLTHLWRSEKDLEEEDGQRIPASQLLGIEQVIRPIGFASRARILAEASEMLAAFGAARTAVVTVHGLMGLHSLASRLVGAFDLLSCVMPGADYPSWIDAARAARGHSPHRAAVPPTSLRGIDGDLCALVRLSDGRSATIHVSDWAASIGFDLRLFSAQGSPRADTAGPLPMGAFALRLPMSHSPQLAFWATNLPHCSPRRFLMQDQWRSSARSLPRTLRCSVLTPVTLKARPRCSKWPDASSRESWRWCRRRCTMYASRVNRAARVSLALVQEGTDGRLACGRIAKPDQLASFGGQRRVPAASQTIVHRVEHRAGWSRAAQVGFV